MRKILLIGLLGLAIVATMAVASGGPEATAPAGGTAAASGGKYSESPMLAELVRSGTLPPVDQRLPANPVVVKVEERIGTYGGTLRTPVANRHNAINSALAGRFTDQSPFTFDKYGGKLEPNWAEEGVLSADGKVFTLKLRKGVRWSDGALVSTEDMVFSIEEVLRNVELYPKGAPNWLLNVKVERLDDLQLRFALPAPSPLFIYSIQDGFVPLAKHFMKQYHPSYVAKEELEKMAKENGVNTWTELFLLKAQNDNVARPVLGLWKLVEAGTEKVVVERNPYFWKVDTAGNQLPYIDRMEIEIATAETIGMRAMAGTYDLTFYNLKFADYPTYKANEKQGGFTVYLWKNASAASHIKFNLNYKGDPVMAQLFRNPEFKKALSYAIDRNEVSELVYLGQGNPVPVSPPVGSEIYEKRFTEMYAQYDVAKARQMLDALGVKDVNGDGMRELPGGGKLEVELNLDAATADFVSTGELVKGYWDAVGVSTKLNPISFERRTQLDIAADYMASMNKIDNVLYPMSFTGGGGLMAAFTESTVASTWRDYIATKGQSGEQPSAEYMAAYDLHQKVLASTDTKTRATLAKQLWEDYYKNYWSIGIIQEVPYPLIVSNRLKNVPKDALNAWPLRTPSNGNLAQFYFGN